MIEDLKIGDWVHGIVGTSDIIGRVDNIGPHGVTINGGFVPYPQSMAQKGGQYMVPPNHIFKRYDSKPSGWVEDTKENRQAHYDKERALCRASSPSEEAETMSEKKTEYIAVNSPADIAAAIASIGSRPEPSAPPAKFVADPDPEIGENSRGARDDEPFSDADLAATIHTIANAVAPTGGDAGPEPSVLLGCKVVPVHRRDAGPARPDEVEGLIRLIVESFRDAPNPSVDIAVEEIMMTFDAARLASSPERPVVPTDSGDTTCPDCGKQLEKVRYTGGCLNEDQWDSVRAGDWYCESCKGKRSRTGYRYFWNRELTPAARAIPREDVKT